MQYDPNRITFFAETDARGKRTRFGIKAKDRTRHVYVIGKTGMGKSTLLENMAVQDIKNGEGMAFMDPHGSTAEKLLEYIPEERVNDVLYLAPFDLENPISFNVLEDVGYDKRHLVVSGLMSTFKKIWVDAWSARMEYILSNTLLALLEYPGSTLLGVNRMLSDKDYRNMVVANIKDPSVKSFWVDEFAKYNERYMQEAGDSIKNKIGQFTSNPLIRNVIGQPTSSFDVRTFMDEKKILIVNLSKGQIGETNANLLGSMLITKIYLAAMSRADIPTAQLERMPNFYFYVDEFQSFANEAFANILSEARKYKLNLTIAHQYIDQMEEKVRSAVFGNVGTTITFRVGPFDAEVLETIFTPEFTATDIVNLGFAQVYLTLMIDGIGSRPFSAITLSPIATSTISYKDVVIAASRKTFAKPRQMIEEGINKWHEPVPKPEPLKRESKRPELQGVLRQQLASSPSTSAPRGMEKGTEIPAHKSGAERVARQTVDAKGMSHSGHTYSVSMQASAPPHLASGVLERQHRRPAQDVKNVTPKGDKRGSSPMLHAHLPRLHSQGAPEEKRDGRWVSKGKEHTSSKSLGELRAVLKTLSQPSPKKPSEREGHHEGLSEHTKNSDVQTAHVATHTTPRTTTSDVHHSALRDALKVALNSKEIESSPASTQVVEEVNVLGGTDPVSTPEPSDKAVVEESHIEQISMQPPHEVNIQNDMPRHHVPVLIPTHESMRRPPDRHTVRKERHLTSPHHVRTPYTAHRLHSSHVPHTPTNQSVQTDPVPQRVARAHNADERESLDKLVRILKGK
jgi:hypothetical protein